MFMQLAATAAIGLVGAGIIYLIAKSTGWKPPSVAYLIAIAVGMVGYAIYDEYSWYSRVSAELPTRLKVVRTYATSMPYQPWTYAAPRVYKFDAVDLASKRVNPNAPDLSLVRMLRVTRNTSSVDISAIVDCSNDRFTEVDATTKFADTGLPVNPTWEKLSGHPALKQSVCSS